MTRWRITYLDEDGVEHVTLTVCTRGTAASAAFRMFKRTHPQSHVIAIRVADKNDKTIYD